MFKVTPLPPAVPLFSSHPRIVVLFLSDLTGACRCPGPVPLPGPAALPSVTEALPGAPPPPAESPPPPAKSGAPRSLAASPEAARALFELLPLVERLLRRYRVHARDVPDIAQNVLVHALPWWARLDPEERRTQPKRCRGYVLSIAANAARHWHRTGARHPEDIGFTADWFDPEHESARPSPPPATAPSAEDLHIEREEAAERASDVNLDRLGRMTSPACWRTFYAHAIAGIPVTEIADAEEVPVATVYHRLLVARADLRAAILRFRAARRPR